MFKWLIDKQVRAEIAELDAKNTKLKARVEALERKLTSAYQYVYRGRTKKAQENPPMKKKKKFNPLNNPEVSTWASMLAPDEKQELYSLLGSPEDGMGSDSEAWSESGDEDITEDSDEDSSGSEDDRE